MDRRKFLTGVGAAVTAAVVPGSAKPDGLFVFGEQTVESVGPKLTATEVLARQEAWLDAVTEELHKVLNTPDVKWFTLKVKEDAVK